MSNVLIAIIRWYLHFVWFVVCLIRLTCKKKKEWMMRFDDFLTFHKSQKIYIYITSNLDLKCSRNSIWSINIFVFNIMQFTSNICRRLLFSCCLIISIRTIPWKSSDILDRSINLIDCECWAQYSRNYKQSS